MKKYIIMLAAMALAIGGSINFAGCGEPAAPPPDNGDNGDNGDPGDGPDENASGDDNEVTPPEDE